MPTRKEDVQDIRNEKHAPQTKEKTQRKEDGGMPRKNCVKEA
jgi:hypothetical protein